MPMLLRIADHFGIDHGVAKDLCKMLVLRVLNGGQVEAWCREMGIAVPEGEPQRDLEDLAEASRIVREAFFAMMERDKPGSLARLRDRLWRLMQDKHGRRVQDAKRKGEAPPQPPSFVQRDRTMFSLCIFNLEDTILDCIDTKLRVLGWTVASLIYDGVSGVAPSTGTHKHDHCSSLLLFTPARPVRSCTSGIASIATKPAWRRHCAPPRPQSRQGWATRSP